MRIVRFLKSLCCYKKHKIVKRIKLVDTRKAIISLIHLSLMFRHEHITFTKFYETDQWQSGESY